MKSKAQISSRLFVYIMAVVIVGMILLVGYKAINTILGFGGKIPIDNFKQDFDNTVSRIARQYGSVETFEFQLPADFEKICFVDSMNEEETFDVDPTIIDNIFIRRSVEDDAPENVFLLKDGVVETSIIVEKLDVEKDYLCIDNQGLMNVTLVGRGDSALLRK